MPHRDQSPTPRERAHREALRAPIDEIASRLQEMLGQRITAYALDIGDPQEIGGYARGEEISPDAEQRLRDLYEITQVLLARETPRTVRAWLLGAHPLLEDQAPVQLLHCDNHHPVSRTADADVGNPGYLAVVNAAEEFVRSA
jgi:hypothetical protein